MFLKLRRSIDKTYSAYGDASDIYKSDPSHPNALKLRESAKDYENACNAYAEACFKTFYNAETDLGVAKICRQLAHDLVFEEFKRGI